MGDLVPLAGKLGPRLGLRRATSAVAWYERGAAVEPHDPAAAMACYERALAGRPELADARNNLGRLHHDRGELGAAEACYRLAICSDATVPLYWFNLGVALEDSRRTAEAITAYEHALERDALMADAHFNLARLMEHAARTCGDDVLLRRAVRHLHRYRELARASG
jgi:tetratricopeptide (TPR) repeat protein